MNTTLPTLHLNGSGTDNLYHEYLAALNAVQHARNALVHATCHQRDFYPQGDLAYHKAKSERSDAFQHLFDVETYLAEWVNHCGIHLSRKSS